MVLSSTETEYMAITKAGKEILWIAQFLATFGYRLLGQPVSLKADNQGIILLTANPELYCRTKHIKMQYHQIRKKIGSKEIDIT